MPTETVCLSNLDASTVQRLLADCIRQALGPAQNTSALTRERAAGEQACVAVRSERSQPTADPGPPMD